MLQSIDREEGLEEGKNILIQYEQQIICDSQLADKLASLNFMTLVQVQLEYKGCYVVGRHLLHKSNGPHVQRAAALAKLVRVLTCYHFLRHYVDK